MSLNSKLSTLNLKNITLKIKGGNAYHQPGSELRLTERIVNIGETADCDVRFEANGLKPEYYASIVRNDDGQSWRIVKRSQYADISIAGKGPVGYVSELSDGDVISFDGQPLTLTFNLNDNVSDNKKRWLPWGIAGVLCLLTLTLTLTLTKKETISEKDVLPLEESICITRVDSVKQIMLVAGLEDSIVNTKVLAGDAPTGTAFLTTDGRLVSARHCVEYWIGTNLDLTKKIDALDKDDVVRWAIETETYNQQHPETDEPKMVMKVWFSIYNFLGEKKYSFASTDSRVHMNKDRDGLFLLADFSGEYYWRSIRPYFNDKKMALGDILWIDDIGETGLVEMADSADMKTLERGTQLMVCGYPMTGTGDKRMIPASGSIKSNPDTEAENLFFESNINHGYSGGPVLARAGNRIVAVGVVSCVDSVSSGLFKWAVPVSEVRSDK